MRNLSLGESGDLSCVTQLGIQTQRGQTRSGALSPHVAVSGVHFGLPALGHSCCPSEQVCLCTSPTLTGTSHVFYRLAYVGGREGVDGPV